MDKSALDANPLREGLNLRRAVEPCVLVIFGASGDLTSRKLIPAIYNLAHEGQLPNPFAIVGFARSPLSHDEFRNDLKKAAQEYARFSPFNEAVWKSLADSIYFQQGDYSNAADYKTLQDLLQTVDTERGTRGNRIFYLATPPKPFVDIITNLRGIRGSSQRLVVEKPFGRSLESARELNRVLRQSFDESEVYRIDHYLGKETVQNILVLRFANEIFEHLWNQKYVDHVQITVAEDLGVGSRGSYYDHAGAIRDMVQNHMMQLVALTGMEPPVSLEPEGVRDEKVKLLRSIRPIPPDQVDQFVVRGQYRAGSLAGKPVVGYLEESDVPPNSATETYLALKLYIDNWRWAGVPFYLRHGKRLPKRAAEIAIQFKSPPAVLFGAGAAADQSGLETNVLVIRIQPDEGIAIRMNAKVPGTMVNIQPVKMDFRYGGSFGARSPDAYERLLHDAIVGDSTLFIRGDEAERSWEVIDAVLKAWGEDGPPPRPYAAGTWGPAEADAFIERDGRQWRRL